MTPEQAYWQTMTYLNYERPGVKHAAASVALAHTIMNHIKTAVNWGALAKTPISKGLQYGAGAAIPAAATGAYLINDAENASARQITNARNKALQVGLGTAAAGAGLMALHHQLGKQGAEKTAGTLSTGRLIKQLGTVGYLSELLDAEKTAEFRALSDLNAKHGAAILKQLLA